ncbi:HDOD domain-containing protein [Curvibacter sp. RS43]|jgi:EAL and modified HD-GYP domain-containing signal transduction protein|uniref:HDOD domain-containing protein n=1 Tax=Curvibacter microcysteis TaxID=3026419 RepID=A0ABT5MIY4_9BURK|nr:MULTISPECIES: HDOD domain-containing protein [unclassified Curvibacter]MDD0811779.1 HDOD domain-containing protein [Curvibacter sp. RS43]MDD0816545.1 HDOD domain-containing protein [Curvibacter sp. HBC28]
MVQSVLGSITLAYRPLWGRSRDLAGVELRVAAEPACWVDAPHLLRTLGELWNADSPPLLLSCDSPELLADLLAHADAEAPQITVPGDWLALPELRQQVQDAHQRGAPLVWRGPLRALPTPDPRRPFHHGLLSLDPEDAAEALQAALHQKRFPNAPSAAFLRSPIQPAHSYENLPSAALVSHCLDQKHARSVLGWPDEDVLYAHRLRELPPSRAVLERLVRAITRDESMDSLEDILSEEPLLCYRFLTLVNSAAFGLRTGIESLRHGLMMMGYTQLEKWIVGQLPHASTDADLQPVRMAMVLRARLMEHILDAGVEEDLRREVYLCGLFSQLDVLLGEPLGTILHRLPLSDRIYAANVTQSGPYVAALDLARALGEGDMAAIRSLRQAHEFDTEELNRALLHMLCSQRIPPSPPPSA